ncbi:enoyl-CoA hydratase-related protein [Pseudonocardia alni]|uniref:enoyl-CoA hydratase-related protein n=1 Tax=Pseudonocardia alni TaxID=33907 RepID=UPI002478923C|nr:enoyl-CoA hydratase-related protein [Pseudonocardia alni]WFG47214.1 enoyl-CoA hydratase/isomerase family protein [Pseudonocardia alni]
MPTLTHDGPDGAVAVLDLGDTENRFHPDLLASVNDLLDQVSACDGPRALVTTATGKFFSNGLDLDWMSAAGQRAADNLADVHALLARLLALPMVTVAAIGGHAFAAGAMLTLAHDLRVMRADRGFWCLPEADLGLPFSPGMSALITARLGPARAHEAMVTAYRYGGRDARTAGIVDDTADAHQAVRDRAVALAARHAAKAGPALGTIKTTLHAAVLAALRDVEAVPA